MVSGELKQFWVRVHPNSNLRLELEFGLTPPQVLGWSQSNSNLRLEFWGLELNEPTRNLQSQIPGWDYNWYNYSSKQL